MVYIIHLDQPMSQGLDPRTGRERFARHYVGYTRSFKQRIDHHRNGTGARMLAVAKERGIPWHVSRVMRGTRFVERKIKNSNHTERYCPSCVRAGLSRNTIIAPAPKP